MKLDVIAEDMEHPLDNQTKTQETFDVESNILRKQSSNTISLESFLQKRQSLQHSSWENDKSNSFTPLETTASKKQLESLETTRKKSTIASEASALIVTPFLRSLSSNYALNDEIESPIIGDESRSSVKSASRYDDLEIRGNLESFWSSKKKQEELDVFSKPSPSKRGKNHLKKVIKQFNP